MHPYCGVRVRVPAVINQNGAGQDVGRRAGQLTSLSCLELHGDPRMDTNDSHVSPGPHPLRLPPGDHLGDSPGRSARAVDGVATPVYQNTQATRASQSHGSGQGVNWKIEILLTKRRRWQFVPRKVALPKNRDPARGNKRWGTRWGSLNWKIEVLLTKRIRGSQPTLRAYPRAPIFQSLSIFPNLFADRFLV
jgi:hypothetical protein